MVAHYLRSPLASIIMNADLFFRKLNAEKLPDSTQKSIKNIKNSAYRMNHLIEDLLDAVKMDGGQFNKIMELVRFVCRGLTTTTTTFTPNDTTFRHYLRINPVRGSIEV